MANTLANSVPRSTPHKGEAVSAILSKKEQSFDYFLAAISTLLILIAGLVWSENVAHWFLIPVGACGILAGVDVVRLFRGKLEFFDPRALVACLMYYGLVVAPVLHVGWDRYGVGYDFILHGDWRVWMGAMATLNVIGLVLFRFSMNFAYRHSEPPKKKWSIDYRIAAPLLLTAWLVSVGSQVYLLDEFGGIQGIINAYERNAEAFVGKGWILVLAWPLSVLSLIGFDALAVPKVGPRAPWIPRVTMIIVGLGVVHLFVLGWYGGRATTVWAIFWMIGILHYRYRKLQTGAIAAGTILLVAFMYFYGFYKEKGMVGLEVVRSPSMWFRPSGYGRDLPSLLLGDLARADVTAYELNCLFDSASDYDYRWGLTYAGAFTILIPRNFWPDRPEFKVEAGTELQHGKTGNVRSARVYGLTGEAMLNFGVIGAPVMMGLYGAALGWYRKKLNHFSFDDARTYLTPFFAIMFASAFIGDSDNVVFGALTEGAWVSALLFFLTKRISVRAASAH